MSEFENKPIQNQETTQATVRHRRTERHQLTGEAPAVQPQEAPKAETTPKRQMTDGEKALLDQLEQAAPRHTAPRGSRVRTQQAAGMSPGGSNVPRPAVLQRSAETRAQTQAAFTPRGEQTRPAAVDIDRPRFTRESSPMATTDSRTRAAEKPQENPDGAPARPQKWLMIALVSVLALALVVLGLLLFRGSGSGLFGLGSQTTSQPAGSVQDFSAAPASGVAPMDITFTLTTRGSADDVRLLDESGAVLPTLTLSRTENSNSMVVWILSGSFNTAYNGAVTVELFNGEGWVSTNQRLTLNVEAPAATLPPVSSNPEAYDLSAGNTVGDVPLAVDFTVSTNSMVDDVRLTNENGDVFDVRAHLVSEGGTENVWLLNLIQEVPYTGLVYVEIAQNGSWQPTQLSVRMEAIGTAPTATPTPTATPEPTEEPTASPAPTQDLSLLATLSPSNTPAPNYSALTVPAATAESDGTMPADEGAAAEDSPTDESAAAEDLPADGQPEEGAPAADGEGEENAEQPAEDTKVTVAAAASADPSLLSSNVRYQNNATASLSSYYRDLKDLINMPDAENYTRRPFGVLTFRGSSFRQNAALGEVAGQVNGLSVLWQKEMGSVKGSGKTTFYGAVYPSQPVIVKWSKEVRELSNIVEEKRATSALREVIVAGDDGRIYFLDLVDGENTRDEVNLGYPMRGAPSISTGGLPFMAVGQYARKMASGTGSIGLRFYNLLNQKALGMIDGLDGKMNRPYWEVGSFETSALIDINSDSLVSVGTNGMLYLAKLNSTLDLNAKSFSIAPAYAMLKSKAEDQSNKHTAVESSLAMYQNYAFYADMGGILRCVDTDTLTVMWAVDTGDAVQAAVALDLDEDGGLWLYTANTLQNRSKGEVTVRRYNALTGEEAWAVPFSVAKPKNNTYIPGAMASPVVGTNSMEDVVIFTLSGLTAAQAEQLDLGSSALPSAVIALDKETGEIAWATALPAYSYSSPVAVYNEEGAAWVVQGCSDGTLYLLDGGVGEEISTLKLDGTLTASPAVYKDILVIATTGNKTSNIYGIALQE